MKTNTETIEEFYKDKFNHLPENLQQELGHFNVFRLEDCIGKNGTPAKYSRRDFFKISLVRGKYLYHYADKTIRNINRTAKEVNELQWEYKTVKSEVMFQSKQSELVKAVEPLGLKELTEAPVVLNNEEEKKAKN